MAAFPLLLQSAEFGFGGRCPAAGAARLVVPSSRLGETPRPVAAAYAAGEAQGTKGKQRHG